ncbi:hypothetical protein LAZ67_2003688 [Cordylochernes scorpioides]|uniref:Uncharacterized protein n=1 Tax=Cordylochernes scorpioides TaxID=51811 RepID=A0ABY6K7R3_9ARAC|nr:hypothetical protein LAZ67_2003688 [Cordylochernes scorpioides]
MVRADCYRARPQVADGETTFRYEGQLRNKQNTLTNKQSRTNSSICNIKGLCSTATKIKLEEIMKIAEKQKIQIIALQETKLNEKYNLKFKNYNILRKYRNKEGGGLAFLIKNLYYEDIAINIPNTSDLEAQGIKQNTNEDFGKAPTRIKDLKLNWISFKNTIIKAAKVSIPRDYALENTDLNKTPGPDGIHGQMISNLGKNGKERLLDIFNNSWKTGKLPQDWKTATIIPIKKLDKSADDPKNYRPISLTKLDVSISGTQHQMVVWRWIQLDPSSDRLGHEGETGNAGHHLCDQQLESPVLHQLDGVVLHATTNQIQLVRHHQLHYGHAQSGQQLGPLTLEVPAD